jgi:hypothetical protein
LDDAIPTPGGTGAETPVAGGGLTPGGAQDQMDVVDIGVEPFAPEFILDIPNISAIDLCVPPLIPFDVKN